MWDFQQRGGEFRRSGFGHTGSCTTNNTEIYSIKIDFAPPIIREKSLIFKKKKYESTTNKNQGLAPLQKISTKWNGKNQILFCLQNKWAKISKKKICPNLPSPIFLHTTIKTYYKSKVFGYFFKHYCSWTDNFCFQKLN